VLTGIEEGCVALIVLFLQLLACILNEKLQSFCAHFVFAGYMQRILAREVGFLKGIRVYLDYSFHALLVSVRPQGSNQ
jgi:hypothetical protein